MNDPFFPQTLQGWISVATVFFLSGLAIWRAYIKVTNDINSVGERVNRVEIGAAATNTEITNGKIIQQRLIDDSNAMRERVASNEKELETLSSELREERIAVMTMLHNNEKAAAERDARTREELAGIRERLNIEKMVQSVVKHMRNHA